MFEGMCDLVTEATGMGLSRVSEHEEGSWGPVRAQSLPSWDGSWWEDTCFPVFALLGKH